MESFRYALIKVWHKEGRSELNSSGPSYVIGLWSLFGFLVCIELEAEGEQLGKLVSHLPCFGHSRQIDVEIVIKIPLSYVDLSLSVFTSVSESLDLASSLLQKVDQVRR